MGYVNCKTDMVRQLRDGVRVQRVDGVRELEKGCCMCIRERMKYVRK